MILTKRFMRKLCGPAVAISAVIVSGGVSAAQLEELVVTAQKKEQSLQDVPINVTVMGGDTMDDFGIENFTDVDVPGVHYGEAGMGFQIYVRGVGSQPNQGFEQSVPFYVDGVYYGRARTAYLGFLDTQSFELLKGPQPTYLGKNAIGGATNLNTRRPTVEFEGTVELAHEFEHEETSVFAAVSGPLSDNFRARAAVKIRAMDGWLTNTAVNGSKKEPQVDDEMARLSFEWDVADNAQIYAKFEYMNAEQEGRNTQIFRCEDPSLVDVTDDCVLNDKKAARFDVGQFPERNPGDPLLPVNAYTDYDRAEFERGYFTDFEFFGGQVRADLNFDGFDVTSVTGFYEFDYQFFEKPDFVAGAHRFFAQIPEAYNQFSQEIRFTSNNDSALSWNFGLYYDQDDLETGRIIDVLPTGGLGNPPLASIPGLGDLIGVAVDFIFEQETTSQAAFGEISYEFNDQWAVKFGGRYSVVEKDAYHLGQDSAMGAEERLHFDDGGVFRTVDVAPPFERIGSREDSKFQPSVILEWRPNGESFYYASFKQGFKAGAFTADFTRQQLIDNFAIELEPEEVDAFEIGAKLDLADGAANLNITAFFTDYTDLQLQALDSSGGSLITVARNAGGAETKGIEIDGRWAMTEEWTLSGTMTFIDAAFTEFPTAPCWTFQTAEEGCIFESGGITRQDLADRDLPFSSEWSGALSLDYEGDAGFQLFGGDTLLLGTISFYAQDGFQGELDQDPNTREDGFVKIDARLGLAAEDGSWEAALVVRNLTDQLTAQWREDAVIGTNDATQQNTYFAISDRPRQIGLQLRYKF